MTKIFQDALGCHIVEGDDGYARCGTHDRLIWNKDVCPEAQHLSILCGEAVAQAWDEGYARATRDAEGDMEPADNPYREGS